MSDSRYTKGYKKYLKPMFKKGDIVICFNDDNEPSYVYKVIDYSITNRRRAIKNNGQCNNYYVCELLKDKYDSISKTITIGIGSGAERMSKVVTEEELSAYLL